MSSFVIRFGRVRECCLMPHLQASSYFNLLFDEMMMMIMKLKSNIEGQQFYEYQQNNHLIKHTKVHDICLYESRT